MDTKFQLQPDVESGKGLWLWVGVAAIVVGIVLAALLR